MELTTLYKIDSRNKLRTWQITNETYELYIESGLVNGLKVPTIIDIVQNNSNRTYEDQAELEYNSRIKKQLRLGYCTTELEARTQPKFKAMKPKKWADGKNHIDYEHSIAQRKLNGRRMTAHMIDGEITLWSYGRVEFVILEHIIADLHTFMIDGDEFDGEGYIHGMSLGKIGSLMTRRQPRTTDVEFHIFDRVSQDGFIDRHIPFEDTTSVKYVEYEPVYSFQDIKTFRTEQVMLGYEGIVIKNTTKPYEFGRPLHQVKYKPIKHDEFTIVDTTCATKGSDRGCIIFICDNKHGGTFKALPTGKYGNKALRRKMYKKRDTYIGLDATIEFCELTDDMMPAPNGIMIEFDRKGKGDL